MQLREAGRTIDGAVQRVSHHITVWPFVFAVAAAAIGGLAFLAAKATPVLNAFAPFSYLIAVLVGLLFAGLATWGVATGWKAIGALGRDATVSPPVPVQHTSLMATIPAPAPLNETDDVREAKNALANFVLQRLVPAISNMQKLISLASFVVYSIDNGSPQAGLARNGVTAKAPRLDHLGPFYDPKTVKSKPMKELENAVLTAISSYSGAADTIASIIIDCHRDLSVLNIRSFSNMCVSWLDEHEKLELDIKAFVVNVNYPILRGHLSNSTFIQDTKLDALRRYRESVTGVYINPNLHLT